MNTSRLTTVLGLVFLLAAGSAIGIGPFPLALLAAYSLIVVLPPLSFDAWARLRWSEGRWVAVVTAAVLAVAPRCTVVRTCAITCASRWKKRTRAFRKPSTCRHPSVVDPAKGPARRAVPSRHPARP